MSIPPRSPRPSTAGLTEPPIKVDAQIEPDIDVGARAWTRDGERTPIAERGRYMLAFLDAARR